MTSTSVSIIAGILGFIAGGLGLFLITNHLEKKGTTFSIKDSSSSLFTHPWRHWSKLIARNLITTLGMMQQMKTVNLLREQSGIQTLWKSKK